MAQAILLGYPVGWPLHSFATDQAMVQSALGALEFPAGPNWGLSFIGRLQHCLLPLFTIIPGIVCF